MSKHQLEFLSLAGGYTGLSKSTLVKMPRCWKSHVAAQMSMYFARARALLNNYWSSVNELTCPNFYPSISQKTRADFGYFVTMSE